MGTPPSGDAEPRGLCKVLPVQRPHHPLGALWLVLLQEDPPGSGDWGLIQRGKEVHVYRGGGLIAWRSSPDPQPHYSPAWGPKPTQAPGMWHQPRSRVLRRIESFFFFLSFYFCHLFWIGIYRQFTLWWVLFCFVLFFRCTATWIIYTWLLCSFSASFPM